MQNNDVTPHELAQTLALVSNWLAGGYEIDMEPTQFTGYHLPPNIRAMLDYCLGFC